LSGPIVAEAKRLAKAHRGAAPYSHSTFIARACDLVEALVEIAEEGEGWKRRWKAAVEDAQSQRDKLQAVRGLAVAVAEGRQEGWQYDGDSTQLAVDVLAILGDDS